MNILEACPEFAVFFSEVNQILTSLGRATVPAEYAEDDLYEMWDHENGLGLSPNGAVVRMAYDEACRKADRKA